MITFLQKINNVSAKINMKTKLFNLTCLAFFFGAFFSTVWYQFSGLKLDFFHESAFPLLYAQTNIETATLFSERFSGREISPISWPVVGSLLLLLGGKISLTTHSLYAFTFSIFVLAVGVAFCRTAKFSFFASIFFLAIVFTSFGPVPSRYLWLDQVWMWPMNSYGVYDFFSLLCVLIYFKTYSKLSASTQVSELGNRNHYLWLGFAVFMFFLFSLNSVRGFLVVSGSVLAAAAFDIAIKEDPFSKKYIKEWVVIFIFSVASLIGLLLVKHITNGVPQPWQDPHKIATIGNWVDFRDRLGSILHTWLSLFNAIPVKGLSVFSVTNLVHISNTFFALFLLMLPVFRLKSISADVGLGAKLEKLVIYKFLFILVLLLISTVYGTSAWTPRYLLPLAYSSIFVLPFCIDSWVKKKRIGAAALVVILFLPAYFSSIVSLTNYSLNDYKKSKFYDLAAFLEREGLSYGFAGPWQSDVLTVNHYSNGKVRLALIDPENNKLQPHRHGDKHWYESSAYSGVTFIALPESVSSTNQKNLDLRAQAIKTLKYGEWIIDVYPGNISDHFDNKFSN